MNKHLLHENTLTSEKVPGTPDIVINAVLFQICWFTAVLAGGFWALIPLALMLWHFARVLTPGHLLIPVALSILGIGIDSLYQFLGIYAFAANPVVPLINLPVWLACLWLGFGLSLPISLAWLVRKSYCFIIACAIFGPLSYVAGRHWQVIAFADEALIWLVLEWSVFAIAAGFFLRSFVLKTDALKTDGLKTDALKTDILKNGDLNKLAIKNKAEGSNLQHLSPKR